MVKHLEKQVIKYVIATLDTPTEYLITREGKNSLTDNIIRATKTTSKNVAKDIANGINMDLVVIPVEISYSLIDETVQS
jgi:hypothetical protein